MPRKKENIVIYKITSPSNKIYIGQTRNFIKRVSEYRCKSAKGQPYLYNSIKKYGFQSHKIEIICELPNDVDQSIVNEYEKLYHSAFVLAGFKTMNSRECGSNGKMSKAAIEKIRQARIGRKMSQHTKDKIRKHNLSVGKRPPNHLGMKRSQETKQKMSIVRYGEKRSDETKIKIGLSMSVPLIDIGSGIYYNSSREFIRLHNISSTTFHRYLKYRNPISNVHFICENIFVA